jgi:hypothetical protein
MSRILETLTQHSGINGAFSMALAIWTKHGANFSTSDCSNLPLL